MVLSIMADRCDTHLNKVSLFLILGNKGQFNISKKPAIEKRVPFRYLIDVCKSAHNQFNRSDHELWLNK